MSLKLIYLCVLLKVATARYAFVPKFYAQDSAIIVDTDKELPKPFPAHKGHAHYQPYPAYQLFPPIKSLKHPPTTEKSASSTTPTAAPTADEYPRDLLEIAQTKLGIHRLRDIPSISKLGELLGTANADETIKYFRQLTATDQGIALVKAYIDSTDYADSTTDLSSDDVKNDAADYANVGKAVEFERKPETTEMPAAASNAKPGFLQRMSAYLHIYNFLPQHKEKLIEVTKSLAPHLEHFAVQGKNSKHSKFQPQPGTLAAAQQKPWTIRQPLPYHYPVPIRPQTSHQRNTGSSPAAAASGAVHLNTPRGFAPLHVQLSKVTNIPPKKLEAFLQNKPKLAELAAKVSRFPIPRERNSSIDAQLISAVQRAIEQDEDLKKLLHSTETLK